ncbi:hypothetical protein DOTSEDRAFT_67763 [Dothistroma septosporum NZE10]|uniref:Uncharacterized protein n=1 Tax=Dothistroma septosporum (strain NZE10 / CBS 128990) TaxID=675120 RepID=N1Q2V6_DOTSN|nr:hypothetical protein DOTSEDRAFT_67763 [Dothistroma septosporum NZE10]
MDSRQQRQAYPQRPPYPQAQPTTSSAASSAFPSASSLASLSSLNAPNMPTQSAPLPSPAVHQPNSYFGSIAAPTSPSTQQQRISQQQQMLSPYVGQRNGGGAPETAPLLQDFSLIAEAAKRAQIATLSRDLGDIGL